MSAAKLAPTILLSDGTRIPAIGLGTYKGTPISGSGEDGGTTCAVVTDLEQAVLDAIDAGYRHFDTALLYESEAEVGSAVRAKIAQGAVKREDVYLCTKLWNNAHRPDLVEATCRQSLANLGLDYVDLYLMHWPVAFGEGPETVPLDADGKVIFSYVDFVDTYKAMEALVHKGLVRSLGLSNFNSVQIKRLMANCTVKPVVNQVECHPFLTQEKLVALCKEFGIKVVAYSPFGSPESTWSGGRVERILDDPTIASIARKYNKTSGQIILRFLVQNNIIPIPKSVTKLRIQQNFDVFDFELTKEDVATLFGLNKNRRVCLLSEAIGHPEYPFSIEF